MELPEKKKNQIIFQFRKNVKLKKEQQKNIRTTTKIEPYRLT